MYPWQHQRLVGNAAPAASNSIRGVAIYVTYTLAARHCTLHDTPLNEYTPIVTSLESRGSSRMTSGATRQQSEGKPAAVGAHYCHPRMPRLRSPLTGLRGGPGRAGAPGRASRSRLRPHDLL
ncbi:hypothetical protein EVAR_50300_1 [Eumeta japonica]|uniref:Uncharacterized protein n=1 Tax=Eumeta variegata TaxID=151549 RepID=A0A4C1XQ30_EUMVA|nr:hypothetical protein EVAR_50300_1 [Eumeta japonica]